MNGIYLQKFQITKLLASKMQYYSLLANVLIIPNQRFVRNIQFLVQTSNHIKRKLSFFAKDFRNSAFSIPPRNSASSILIFQSRKVLITLSCAGADRAVPGACATPRSSGAQITPASRLAILGAVVSGNGDWASAAMGKRNKMGAMCFIKRP